ncbi:MULTISPECIES: FAD-binding and (Fe-S)-binding domain-containing protein [Streptomycetaceae]|uniref:Oxidoreductase n=1 Tax=Streptantibioticus cattleyicolor (strain ATCC 35852 / DSM 46488 / JCM 4925 / NBRC 14057 / NRRL 8057) TaxID=1003195 RepID=F8JZ85_STREN|nr:MULTISPECIES: FAD-binding and (Fe-S)-binding domain-containing protein [Streptomycetaceae]AEW94757.1 oxidoreductase [Streptantibioticus cattleyicolor NRRL 8057 = DSM 46488]MYS59385.1 FAD-binding protein [Streptomyces sp. SID5468]CCB75112.1 putative oxidoreductase [Streptantibioticus cattleyicolor NRRL 8057 = DSM 46488]
MEKATDERAELERALRRAVRGEVAADPASRALTTMDASNYRRVPRVVVAPRDAGDVAAALAVCAGHGVPVVPRGGATSIAGQATGTGVVLDFTRHMNRVTALDPEARTAVVQPGVVLDTLRGLAARHGLTFGPDPSTHSRCTLGGMIGNNACGAHSVAWGTTADNVLALDALTYGGERLRAGRGTDGLPPRLRAGIAELTGGHLALLRTGYPDLPRRISGYALDALLPERGTDVARALTGSEGTLAVVTEATVRLVASPAARALAVLGYPDEGAAADAVPALLPLSPLTVEGMAADLAGTAARTLPDGTAWLFVETGGATPAEAAHTARLVCAASGAAASEVVTDPAARRALWRLREDAAGTATRMPDGTEAWPGWEDCAVPPARLGGYLREFRALLSRYGLRGVPYGHFGEGCVHVRVDFDLLTPDGVARYRDFSTDLAALVVAHGGSLSGEHGDGQARAELLPAMYGGELVALFHRFKDLWDPAGGLNPGILARPARLDENLRFAVLPRRPVDVAFGYPQDGGDFTAAVRRCVGVAKCRSTEVSAQVMCPSFRVTGEERHSTRGRARLLHEMLAGEVVTGGWRSPEVRDALDLCLACKGCRSDCPVGVDMATYKAEFLYHHYAGRPRPVAHHTMGALPRWLRAAAALRLPPVLNALARTPLAAVAKRLGGITPERAIPPLATEPFTRWWRADGRAGDDPAAGPAVVLWPDTFTTYLRPEAGRAAVRVLRAAGLRVVVPPAPVCCGLTWVTTGQLDRARAVMGRALDVLRPALDAGLPVVGLEPSCTAALRSDLPELLGTADARRLAGVVRTFAQALAEYAPDWRPPRVDRPVTGQTHCHQHAVLGDAAERRLRELAGLTGELTGGCCGLAGDFGFVRGHFEVSRALAEEQLLPAVRSAPPGAVVLADGFSCRTQLAQLGGVTGRHLAEVLAEALPGTA